MRHLRRESVFDDQVGLLEAGFDVALAPLKIGKHVAGFFHGNGQTSVRKQIGMKHRRAVFDRRHRIEQRCQFIVLNFDQLQRRFRRLLGFRRDGRNFFANEADHAIGQHGRVIDAPADA
ncbi:MAG: hypothetical protein HW419_1990 [Deltaproteobacteria bacterium]|nr:hypothetical protein [Deltaproteobacteria bacterium]